MDDLLSDGARDGVGCGVGADVVGDVGEGRGLDSMGRRVGVRRCYEVCLAAAASGSARESGGIVGGP